MNRKALVLRLDRIRNALRGGTAGPPTVVILELPDNGSSSARALVGRPGLVQVHEHDVLTGVCRFAGCAQLHGYDAEGKPR